MSQFKLLMVLIFLMGTGAFAFAEDGFSGGGIEGVRMSEPGPGHDDAVSQDIKKRNDMAALEKGNLVEEITDPLTGNVVQRTLFENPGNPRRIERYDPDGTPVSTTSYSPGEEQTDTDYAPDGKVRRKIVYKNDVLISSTEFDSDGSRTVIQKSGETEDGKPIYTAEPSPNP